MASCCNTRCFLNRKFPLQLLIVLTMTTHLADTETGAPVELKGEVGGNVTLQCPVDRERPLIFLYFQRGDIFVNGYHASKPLTNTWENTRVDRDMTMHMEDLNVSHSGSYQCHIRYHDGQINLNHTVFHLSVTANYSKPTLTVNCGSENHRFSCWATCASHGGYPGTKVTWTIPESQTRRDVNNTQIQDPHTMLVNSSSTAFFNCSNGKLTSLSCSVGGVTSEMFTVCTPKTTPETFSPYVITAAVCAVVVAIIIALVLWFKCKKGQRRAAAAATAVVAAAADVQRGNECQEELTVLNET
ncbi:uncharacterized protein LOC125888761 isoform X1 [Epinephelus fuscoguttatus]|uniref:uncharacterized protein LOC125888761 isoform X1 n=1 Tax=Epinephelus fuscoguttatus TaxID=293821 RepID=UPI0020D0E749|nr:uncharacterized protein LOC125888761 isoform X1 [Epinephelus fuscoguttatus]